MVRMTESEVSCERNGVLTNAYVQLFRMESHLFAREVLLFSRHREEAVDLAVQRVLAHQHAGIIDAKNNG